MVHLSHGRVKSDLHKYSEHHKYSELILSLPVCYSISHQVPEYYLLWIKVRSLPWVKEMKLISSFSLA
jgi:hypothetical protein